MVNISKSGNSIKFVFTDSDHYLYGNGEIEVPVNSLLLAIDESEMVTFKKISGDPFLSFRADNSNLGTKAAIEQFYKENMVGAAGISEEEVQEMIDAATSGIPSSEVVEQLRRDVNTVSGDVETKVATSDFNAYSAATATALGNKQDALEYYSEIDDIEESLKFSHIEVRQGTDEDNVSATFDVNTHYTEDEKMSSVDLSAAVQNDNGFGSSEISVYNGQIYLTNDYEPNEGEASESHIFMSQNGTIEIGNSNEDGGTLMYIQPTGVTINYERVLTEGDVTSAITSGSTDSEIPTAKATYDAIQAGGGGGAIYSAGTNISIANDVISVDLPIEKKHFWNGDGIAIIGNANSFSDASYSAGIGLSNRISASRAFILGSYCTAKASYSVALNANNITNAQFSLAANQNTTTNNVAEAAFGSYNNSVTGSTASGQTLFSVGNGTSSARHNAFEIRQNGDIYIALNGQDVKLQDQLGGGGGMDDDTQQLISTAFNDLNDRKADLTELSKYQKKGDYVRTSTFAETLSDYMTNASFDEYATAKERIISGALNDLNDKFGGLRLVKISQTDYDNLATKDENTLYIINNVI